MKTLAVIFVLTVLSGCAFSDGYQFGDITKTLINARNIYCTSTDPQQRAAAKAKLEAMGYKDPTGSEGGICAITIEVAVDQVINSVVDAGPPL